jgi:branched-chain amino acid transport system permease protein
MVLFGAKPHNVQAVFTLPTVKFSVYPSRSTFSLPSDRSLMMIFLQIFVKKTRLGKAMRAVPQDRDAAVLYGINVNFIITVTFAIGSRWRLSQR